MLDSLVDGGLFEPEPGERELLWAAAMLHDVGMTISYDDHHKHSYYLIVSAELPGFDPRERALIAQIGRYHRKGTPKLGEMAPLRRRRRRGAARALRGDPAARRAPRARPRPVGQRRASCAANGDGVDLHLKAAGDLTLPALERRALRRRRDLPARVRAPPADRVTPRRPTGASLQNLLTSVPRMRRCLLVLVAAFVAALAAAPAQAAPITGVFAGQTMSGNPIPCTTQSDGVRVCHGTDNGGGAADLRLKAFDGSPLEVWVILPPAPRSGSDGHYPLDRAEPRLGRSADRARRHAVLRTDRRRLGKARIRGDAARSSRLGRLMWHARFTGGRPRRMPERLHPARRRALRGPRHPVRDGLLVDDGVVDPNRIGATGESYGGGVSLELATLKDRIMNADGTLSPWTSPERARRCTSPPPRP